MTIQRSTNKFTFVLVDSCDESQTRVKKKDGSPVLHDSATSKDQHAARHNELAGELSERDGHEISEKKPAGFSSCYFVFCRSIIALFRSTNGSQYRRQQEFALRSNSPNDTRVQWRIYSALFDRRMCDRLLDVPSQ